MFPFLLINHSLSNSFSHFHGIQSSWILFLIHPAFTCCVLYFPFCPFFCPSFSGYIYCSPLSPQAFYFPFLSFSFFFLLPLIPPPVSSYLVTCHPPQRLFFYKTFYIRKHSVSTRTENKYTGTVRKVLADFAVCDWWRYYKALCDVKFSQMKGNCRKIRHKELSNDVLRQIF